MPEDYYQLSELKRAYKVLGIPADSTTASIKRAYRQLVRRWHPDLYQHGTPDHLEATRMAELINEAYGAITHAPLRDRRETDTVPRKFAVIENAYEEEWRSYRARRNKIFLILAIDFAGSITLPFCIGFAEKFFGTKLTSILMLSAGISFVVILIGAPRLLTRFSCPRCRNNFFGATLGPFGGCPALSWYRQSCAYCGLRRGD